MPMIPALVYKFPDWAKRICRRNEAHICGSTCVHVRVN